jgi:hypothetical protein
MPRGARIAPIPPAAPLAGRRLRLFDPGDGPWEVTDRGDGLVRRMSARHYSRRGGIPATAGPPGRVLVLRAGDDSAAWVSHYSRFPADGLDAFRCALFRNEGAQRSSDLIRAAVALTLERWGPAPAGGWVTYVDPAQVRSVNPGWCFKCAGWVLERGYRGNERRPLIRLRLLEGS